PKQRRGRAEAAPATVVGTDPSTGKEILLKEGRFGPYVTDGETNASLRTADDPRTIGLERAADLLAERRAKGPAAPRKRVAKKATKKPAKKSAAKKATAKK
ncbi:MAG TPA: topoisomerase C-terminal repeat-containing protein, partial [Candidatus Nanopelagicales bacterium]|nr:topoisomerase C-terminal repeat-containing protein [Candidatus Nanopelagicales bacterium]